MIQCCRFVETLLHVEALIDLVIISYIYVQDGDQRSCQLQRSIALNRYLEVTNPYIIRLYAFVSFPRYRLRVLGLFNHTVQFLSFIAGFSLRTTRSLHMII